jgi:hypothetical protein
MDPKEWQRLADEVAAEVGSALDAIESEFWPEPSDPSFRSFWPRIRALGDRLRTAPAIDIENKLQLLGRVRQITKRAREDQEVFFGEQRHRKQELLDRIEELRAQAIESSDPEDVRRLRQELADMRDTVSTVQMPTRGDRQEVWDSWHAATKSVWDHLSALWQANEQELSSLLDQAQSRLDRGNIREARDFVRQFNSRSHALEVSHKLVRSLRARANELWRGAEEVAKAKHETFVATAPRKVERWKNVKGRNTQAIARLRAEIGELEANENAGGVAAAFARAMISDKLRELGKLESTNDSLEDRIESTEAALTTVG